MIQIAKILLLISLFASIRIAQGACVDETRSITVDEAESYGISLEATRRTPKEYLLDISIQSEICVKTTESECGQAIYRFHSIKLVKDKATTVLPTTVDSRIGSAVASVVLSNKQLALHSLQLDYIGSTCGDGDSNRVRLLLEKLQSIRRAQ